jgi:hypothetical protein
MNTTFGYQNDGSPLSTIQHELSSGGVKLYPNPVNAQLTVTYKGNKQVDIYSVFGNKIHTDSGLEKVVINTSQYAEGIYFVKCEHEVLKFVVAH